MSDTPRTDAVAFDALKEKEGWHEPYAHTVSAVPLEFAEQLERELNEERENVQALENQLNNERKRRQKLWNALHAAKDLLEPHEFEPQIEDIETILADTKEG